MRDLTEDEVLHAIRTADLGSNTVRLTYDSGPYEVTRPTPVAEAFARAVNRKFCEVNSLPLPSGVQACCHRTSSDAPHARWCPVHGEGADGVTGTEAPSKGEPQP